MDRLNIFSSSNKQQLHLPNPKKGVSTGKGGGSKVPKNIKEVSSKPLPKPAIQKFKTVEERLKELNTALQDPAKKGYEKSKHIQATLENQENAIDKQDEELNRLQKELDDIAKNSKSGLISSKPDNIKNAISKKWSLEKRPFNIENAKQSIASHKDRIADIEKDIKDQDANLALLQKGIEQFVVKNDWLHPDENMLKDLGSLVTNNLPDGLNSFENNEQLHSALLAKTNEILEARKASYEELTTWTEDLIKSEARLNLAEAQIAAYTPISKLNSKSSQDDIQQALKAAKNTLKNHDVEKFAQKLDSADLAGINSQTFDLQAKLNGKKPLQDLLKGERKIAQDKNKLNEALEDANNPLDVLDASIGITKAEIAALSKSETDDTIKAKLELINFLYSIADSLQKGRTDLTKLKPDNLQDRFKLNDPNPQIRDFSRNIYDHLNACLGQVTAGTSTAEDAQADFSDKILTAIRNPKNIMSFLSPQALLAVDTEKIKASFVNAESDTDEGDLQDRIKNDGQPIQLKQMVLARYMAHIAINLHYGRHDDGTIAVSKACNDMLDPINNAINDQIAQIQDTKFDDFFNPDLFDFNDVLEGLDAVGRYCQGELDAVTNHINELLNTALGTNDIAAIKQAKTQQLIFEKIKDSIAAIAAGTKNPLEIGYLETCQLIFNKKQELELNKLRAENALAVAIEDVSPENIGDYIAAYPEQLIAYLNTPAVALIADQVVLDDIKNPYELHNKACSRILDHEFQGKSNQKDRAEAILDLQKRAAEAYLVKKEAEDPTTALKQSNEAALTYKLSLKIKTQAANIYESQEIENADKKAVLDFAENLNKEIATIVENATTDLDDAITAFDNIIESGMREVFVHKERISADAIVSKPENEIIPARLDLQATTKKVKKFTSKVQESFSGSGQTVKSIKTKIENITTAESIDLKEDIKVLKKDIQALQSRIAIDEKALKDLKKEQAEKVQKAKEVFVTLGQDLNQLANNKGIQKFLRDMENTWRDMNTNIAKEKAKKLAQVVLTTNIKNFHTNAKVAFEDLRTQTIQAVKQNIQKSKIAVNNPSVFQINDAALETAITEAIENSLKIEGAPGDANFKLVISKDLFGDIQKAAVDKLMENFDINLCTEAALDFFDGNDIQDDYNAPSRTEASVLQELMNSKKKDNTEYDLNHLTWLKANCDEQGVNGSTRAAYNALSDTIEKKISIHQRNINELEQERILLEENKAELEGSTKVIQELSMQKSKLAEQQKKLQEEYDASIEPLIKKYIIEPELAGMNKAADKDEYKKKKAEIQEKSQIEQLLKVENKIGEELDAEAIEVVKKNALQEDLKKLQNHLKQQITTDTKIYLEENRIAIEETKIETGDKPILRANQKLTRLLTKITTTLDSAADADNNIKELENLKSKDIVNILKAESVALKDALETLSAIKKKGLADAAGAKGFKEDTINTLEQNIKEIDAGIQALTKIMSKPMSKNNSVKGIHLEEVAAVARTTIEKIAENIKAIEKLNSAEIDKIDANSRQILKASRLNIWKALSKITLTLTIVIGSLSAFGITFIGLSTASMVILPFLTAGLGLGALGLNKYGKKIGKLSDDFGDKQEKVQGITKNIKLLRGQTLKTFNDTMEKRDKTALVLSDVFTQDVKFGVNNASMASLLDATIPLEKAAQVIIKAEDDTRLRYLKALLDKEPTHADYYKHDRDIKEKFPRDLRSLAIFNMWLALADPKQIKDCMEEPKINNSKVASLKTCLKSALNLQKPINRSDYISQADKQKYEFYINEIKTKLRANKIAI